MKRAFVESHIAGDTLEMSIANGNAISVPDYPASDGWTLAYRLTPKFTTPTQAPIDITATTDTDGESYTILVSNATTAVWVPGSYSWARRVSKTGAAVTLDVDGQLDIIPNPMASVQGDDRRSWARIELERVESAISAISYGAKSYAIGSRSFTREDMPNLLVSRSRLKWLVANEDARDRLKAGMPNPRNVGVRMGRI